MRLDKKSVFMLGACYGAFVTIGGMLVTKAFNKMIEEKIDKKVGRMCYSDKTHNNSVPPFGNIPESPFSNSSVHPFGSAFGDFEPEDKDVFSKSIFDDAPVDDTKFSGSIFADAPKGFGNPNVFMGASPVSTSESFGDTSTSENTSENDFDKDSKLDDLGDDNFFESED